MAVIDGEKLRESGGAEEFELIHYPSNIWPHFRSSVRAESIRGGSEDGFEEGDRGFDYVRGKDESVLGVDPETHSDLEDHHVHSPDEWVEPLVVGVFDLFVDSLVPFVEDGKGGLVPGELADELRDMREIVSEGGEEGLLPGEDFGITEIFDASVPGERDSVGNFGTVDDYVTGGVASSDGFFREVPSEPRWSGCDEAVDTGVVEAVFALASSSVVPGIWAVVKVCEGLDHFLRVD